MVSGRSLILIRHPGLDPGSTAAAKSWTPDQVRGDDEGIILPVAQPWGGGPSPQAMVEGRPRPRHLPLRQRFALPPPYACGTGRINVRNRSLAVICKERRPLTKTGHFH